MRISTQKKVLIINLILILSIFIISLNQVFANEQEDANTKFIERLGETRFNNIPLDNHKFKKSILAAGPIAPTNTSFENAQIIQDTNTKMGNANSFVSYYYKFVPQVTGIYNITNYATIATESGYVNFSVTLYDSNEHEIASNIENTMVVDEASGRLNEIRRYKNKMSYAFIAGETYFIVINDVSVSYKFILNFEQGIEVNKNELVLVISNANKIHDEAVEGSQSGQYEIGAKVILITAITAAQQVADNINSTQADIDTAIVSLNTAINNFEKMKNTILTSEMNKLLLEIGNANKILDEAVEGSQRGQYKIGAKAILETAITSAQQIADNINSTQADINAAIVSLNTAIKNFEKVKNTVATSEMNKLILAIANASKIHDEAVEGNQGGQYKIGSKAILKTAITVAQQVADNIRSTELNINTAIVSLNTAISNFEKMKNSSIYEFEYDSVSYRLQYILKDGKRIVEFIYDENGNLKQKKKIIN